MSLINQVLQDLDKRQQAADKHKPLDIDEKPYGSVISNEPQDDFVRPKLQYQAQHKLVSTRSQARLYLLMGVIAIAAIVAGVWLLSLGNNIIPQAKPVMANKLDASKQTQVETGSQQAYELPVHKLEVQDETILVASKPLLQVPDEAQQIEPEPELVQERIQELAQEPEPALAPEHKPESLVVKTITPVLAIAPVAVKEPSPGGNMQVVEVVLTADQKANKLMLSAENAEGNGNLAQAKADYLKVLALAPTQIDARKKLLGLYYAQGEQDKAMALVEQAINDSAEPWQWVLLKAKLQHSNGASAIALTTLATIPEQGVWAKDKWAAQGDIAQKLGQFIVSEQAYRALTLAEAHKGLWWMGLAYAQDSQQQYSLARQSYLAAYERAGLSSSARAFIENRLQELGEGR